MRRALLLGVPALVVGLVAALAWFEPWRLWTSSSVDEALPTSREPVAQAEPAEATASSSAPAAPAAPTVLFEGRFERAEHATTGRASVIRLADGRRFLRLSGLRTSDGPDLHVWLSDQPSGGRWGSYDDGRYLRLGELEATRGNQNYPIPAGADLTGQTTAVIWCDRFDVAFGTATLAGTA